MLSMTGYGKGEYKENEIEMTVEIKTVNNRFLDASIKAPKIFAGYEDYIRSTIREKLTRGHADVFINFTDKRKCAKNMYVDMSLATALVEAKKSLKQQFPELTDDFTLSSLMRYPDVVRSEEKVGADEQLALALKTSLEKALNSLNIMRQIEGEKLEKDMLSRMQVIEEYVKKIQQRSPLVLDDYKNRLTERVKKYLEDVEVDQARLLNEIAIFTDKCNIDEEITRLYSHISQFRTICQECIVGRKLDFLVQEFNRESNTVCSKSNDLVITQCGLALKNEIEKVREQVQNLE